MSALSARWITVLSANSSSRQRCDEGRGHHRDHEAAAPVRVTLSGVVSVAASSARGAANASELVWTLLAASSDQLAVRAVDLGFGFVGLSNADAMLVGTHQSKTWCPAGTGCWEWNGDSVTCKVGSPCSQTESAGSGWIPPSMPWAFAALQVPGRSAFAGGFSSSAGVGYAGWSSQPALPFQNFGSFAGDVHDGGGVTAGPPSSVAQQVGLPGSPSGDASAPLVGFSTGSARINTNLRCGSTLPVTLRFGFFGDISGDGNVSQDDAEVYAREQYPLADAVYRAGLVLKLDSDITSYTAQEGMPRISFNATMDMVKKLSALADNTTIVLTLVGWQGSGHDTLYPRYNVSNPNLGTSEDLWRLVADAKRYNTVISYHINTDEAYKNLTVTQGDNFTVG